MAAPVDYARAITQSLFTQNSNSTAPSSESFIAHLQTFEDVPGSSARKDRFLILSSAKDEKLKLHKAKQNANGSFSIGKTWAVEDLQAVNVSKPLEFTLVINSKSYKYETALPSTQQAIFLVTLVRCWRRYNSVSGRNSPDLTLTGFSVDNARPTTPGSSSSYTRAIPSPQGLSSSATSPSPYFIPPPNNAQTPRQALPPLSNSPSTPLSATGSGPPPFMQNGATPYSQGRRQSGSSSLFGERSMAGIGTKSATERGGYSPSSATGSLPPTTGRPSLENKRSNSNSSIPTRSKLTTPPPPTSPPSRQQPFPLPPETPKARRPSLNSPPGSSSSSISRVISPPPASNLRSSPSKITKAMVGPPSSAGSTSSNFSAGARGGPRDREQSVDTAISSLELPPALNGGGAARQNANLSPSPLSAFVTPSPTAAPKKPTSFSSPSTPLDPRHRPVSPSTVIPSSQSQPLIQSRPPVSMSSVSASASLPHSLSPIIGTPASGTAAIARFEDTLVDEDTVLGNVEEMLEGFEWRAGAEGTGKSGGGKKGAAKGKADEIEGRLVGELKALEAASIHAIMESDDRVTFVIKHLDDAIAELDKMDMMMGMYKNQLEAMSDDIAHIEGQNRGLQVQTSNQRALVSELDSLMETIHIPDADLTALTQESLESPVGVERLEKAAVSLYKALLSTRDTPVGEMAAASERVGEYQTKANQFCKRLSDFLAIMFKFQVDQLVNPKIPPKDKSGMTLPSHSPMEDFLGRYCGLMLFVKEIHYERYQAICAAYFSAVGELHRSEIQTFMGHLKSQLKLPSEEELESNFVAKDSPTMRQQSMKRAGTIVRGLDGRTKEKDSGGKLSSADALDQALTQIIPAVLREQGFISDFLHINPLDLSITFAEYMSLEMYFRRGAMSYLASQQSKLRDIRTAMDIVFAFLEEELRSWIEGLVVKDVMQIVGVLVAFDKGLLKAEADRNDFLLRTFTKQYQKSLATLERACKEHMKNIEQTKLTIKKRKGVVPFIRVFPMFVSRVETQLEGASELKTRSLVDTNYERITATMFESLQQLAKMDGEAASGEAKGQLNYHVIIIENMHHIVTVFSNKRVPALATFVSQARDMYNENLDLYIKFVLRRPLTRILDFFHGLEQLLQTTPPTEVSLHSAYSRSALKKATSDVRAKDLRKAIDALYKRVDKHFGDASNPSTEDAAVIKTVWKACEEEMLKLTATWKSLIDKCYPDEKGGLEFGASEVSEYFLKAQSSS